MHPDAEPDTRSPWYEAFAQRPHETRPSWMAAPTADAVVQGVAQTEAAEPEWTSQALFDCYNG